MPQDRVLWPNPPKRGLLLTTFCLLSYVNLPCKNRPTRGRRVADSLPVCPGSLALDHIWKYGVRQSIKNRRSTREKVRRINHAHANDLILVIVIGHPNHRTRRRRLRHFPHRFPPISCQMQRTRHIWIEVINSCGKCLLMRRISILWSDRTN